MATLLTANGNLNLPNLIGLYSYIMRLIKGIRLIGSTLGFKPTATSVKSGYH